MRVMQNVRRLRMARGLSYKDLSSMLDSVGRPIPVLGLSRLERGERRADADDLVALAVVLGVTPNKLLLPELPMAATLPSATNAVPLTAKHAKGRPARLWAWATGDLPLYSEPTVRDNDERDREVEVAFGLANRPHHFDRDYAPGHANDPSYVRAYMGITAAVHSAIEDGFSTAEVRGAAESAIVSGLFEPETDLGEDSDAADQDSTS